MGEMTALDRAHARMQADAEDEGSRRAYYDRLAASELFLLTEAEAKDGAVTPCLAPVEGVSYAIAFDTEDRLGAFAGSAAAYVALGGRSLAGMLAPEGLGLALNPDVAPSAYLLPPEAVAWIAEATARPPEEVSERPIAVAPPGNVPTAWLEALDSRLAAMAGLAERVWLCAVDWPGGRRGHLVAVEGARPEAGAALARAVSDCSAIVGEEAAEVSVLLLDAGDPMADRIARVGLRFDLPEPPRAPERQPPGSDPDSPPRLR